MESLKNYFLYNNDYSNINHIYDRLSVELKKVHSDGNVVENLSSDNTVYDSSIGFSSVVSPMNFEAEKRKNVVAFAKMMLGTYLSLSTGFIDFSSVPDEFFTEKLDEICSSITSDGFYEEYFYDVFVEGKNEYYCDFLARKRQENALNGKSNVNSYKKVLTNAASSLYYDAESEEDYFDASRKQAKVHSYFYPILIVSLLILICLIVFLINIL